ncbi:MAG: hypothetical protein HOP03_10660 [Lysobacter sp.]|nr:hypothetical protein [Lysobacter sp.]
MTTSQPPIPLTDEQIAVRRASARRTALIAACIAVAVYVGFIALNALSQ